MHTAGRLTLLILLLAGCAPTDPPPAVDAEPARATPITGSASYRERISLGPNARLEVRLLDVSRADAPATTLGIARIRNPGLPPIDFRLDYNPANIDPRKTYVVRGEISDGDELLFTTDTAVPVLTGGADDHAELLLVAVDHSPPETAPLLGTRWRLIGIDGQPVANKAPPDDAHLVLAAGEGGATGNAGCNRFTGSYELDGDALAFGPLATTRVVGEVESMELEARFLAALATVTRAEVVEGELRLYNGATLVLTFVAIT